MDTRSYEYYHWYKDHGICVECRKEKAAKGKTMCPNCLSKIADKRWERYNRMTEEEREEKNRIRREKSKALRDYRRANGLCTICGEPVYKNYSKCYRHYIYCMKYTRRGNEKKKKGYAELGLCRFCGKPTAEGTKLCAEHLEQYRERMKHAQAIKMKKVKGGAV